MTGPPGRPLRAGAPIIDLMGGVFGVVAALSALRERDLTGVGQRVSSSLFESATFVLGALVAGSAAIGGPIPPMPARKNAWGIYDVFTARDGGQAFIGCTSDRHWLRFRSVFGFKEWSEDPRLSNNASRCEAREWLLPELEARLGRFSLDEILERCDEARVAYSRVGRPDELPDDPQMRMPGALLATAISGLGGGPQIGIPALPMEFGDQRLRPSLDRQPPRIGEHSCEILGEAGFPIAEISRLVTAGIIAAPGATQVA